MPELLSSELLPVQAVLYWKAVPEPWDSNCYPCKPCCIGRRRQNRGIVIVTCASPLAFPGYRYPCEFHKGYNCRTFGFKIVTRASPIVLEGGA